METCLLIPDQLTVAVTRHANPTNSEKTASIWSKTNIPAGYIFYSDEGQIFHGQIDVHTAMDKNDVKQMFGGYDLILDVQGHKIRHCNWVRFVRSTTDINIVNIVGTNEGSDRVAYRAVKEIRTGEELVVHFVVTENRIVNSKRKCNNFYMSEEDEEIDVCGLSEDEEIFTDCEQSKSSKPKSDIRSCGSMTELHPRKRMRFVEGEEEFDSGIGDISSIPEESGSISSPEPYDVFELKQSSNHCEKRHSTPISSANNSLKRKRGRDLLGCEFCGKEFDRPSLLKRHERTHTGEKPYVCDVCNKGFSTTSAMNTHRRIHFGEKPHECNICGKKFTASSNLYYHRMTHTKEKPHKCTLCTKSFPTPGDLRSHMHIHNGTYPYTCGVCQKGFSKQASFKQHMLSHKETQRHPDTTSANRRITAQSRDLPPCNYSLQTDVNKQHRMTLNSTTQQSLLDNNYMSVFPVSALVHSNHRIHL